MLNNMFKLIDLPLRGDERGRLVAIEGTRSIPFDIKRVYYIFGTEKETPRGFHAHKKLEQFAVCVAGSCRIIFDDGFKKEEITLNVPNQGVTISKMIWHEMHDFTEDCILLVLADDLYSENDYIRDYDDFIKRAKNV